MTDQDIFAELTLQLARDGSEPSAADQARNLAALRARLGLPGAGATSSGLPGPGLLEQGPSGGGLSGGEARANVQRAFESGQSSRAGWRLVGASTFTGVTGFILGLFLSPALPGQPETAARGPELLAPAKSGPRDTSPEHGAERASASDAVADGASAPPARVAEAPRGRPAPGSDDAARATVPGATPPHAPHPRSRNDRAPGDSRSTRAASSPARATSRASANDNPSFLEAVRWLRRAQRAVRRGEGALALGLLDELDARFPPELLGEERQATRVLGLCGTGDDERALELARALLAKSPRSIYAERLRSSCAAPALGADAAKNDLDRRE